MKNKLYLKHAPSAHHINGLWEPEDHESQRLMLQHFSGGSIAIAHDRLREIVYIAGLHGVEVQTEGGPEQ